MYRNYWKGKTIFANYALKKIPFTPVINPEQIQTMQDGFFAGDERKQFVFKLLSVNSGYGHRKIGIHKNEM